MSSFARIGLLLVVLTAVVACREPLQQRGMTLMDEGRYQEVIDLVEPALLEGPGDY